MFDRSPGLLDFGNREESRDDERHRTSQSLAVIAGLGESFIKSLICLV